MVPKEGDVRIDRYHVSERMMLFDHRNGPEALKATACAKHFAAERPCSPILCPSYFLDSVVASSVNAAVFVAVF